MLYLHFYVAALMRVLGSTHLCDSRSNGNQDFQINFNPSDLQQDKHMKIPSCEKLGSELSLLNRCKPEFELTRRVYELRTTYSAQTL